MSVAAFLAALDGSLKSGIATEHTYRPALQSLFETILSPAKATNEPKHAQYGAPDFVIQQGNTPIGHIEAKDIGVKLDQIITDSEREQPRQREGTQLKRYRAALPNLLFTDGLEWHWFVNGEARLDAPLRVGTWNKAKQKLAPSPNAEPELASLLQQFAAQQLPTVNTPRELAGRLAQAARWLHDVIVDVLTAQGAQGDLHQQLTAFRQTLLPTLKEDEFADMYAQTIVYGLFAARVAVPEKQDFSRLDAAMAIPRTNPFLRKLFQEIAGYDLDERIAWLVDDCAGLLARTDIGAVLKDFGKATKQEDPVVHFYETFLAAYNPALRESRGVYYTPEPVVSYIVRSVDSLLKSHFNKPMGLADDSTVILDPATGTATFPHAVVQRIHATLSDMGLAGAWDSYVADKLLPRLFGFELLMAPYTIAHLKLGLLLGQLGYQFGSNERLGIYLTNALEGAPSAQLALPFAQYIAQEGQAANVVKHDMPVMVVLGNPPYSGHSTNVGDWIKSLIDDYKQGFPDLHKPAQTKWLQDDYVKFIRFAQWRITRTGEGILAFITNNGYLDNPTFKGMRKRLMEDFDTIYILNLHGNTKKKERSPDGSAEENVFDIQQGVAIGLFVRTKRAIGTLAKVYYADVWGDRKSKYAFLASTEVESTDWVEVAPGMPTYLFKPQSAEVKQEYELGWKLQAAMGENGDPAPGIVTTQDEFAISWSVADAKAKVCQLLATANEQEARAMWRLCTQNQWQYARAKAALSSGSWEADVCPILYRPFDLRWTVYNSHVAVHRRERVMRHMRAGSNLALCISRGFEIQTGYEHVFCSDAIIQHHTVSIKEVNFLFPLYLYADKNKPGLFDGNMGVVFERRANFSEAFIAHATSQTGLKYTGDGRGGSSISFGPEDLFHYIYAALHSPTYRKRYKDFLKADFARIPTTSDVNLFRELVSSGAELVDLHLLRLPGSSGVGGNGGAAILVAPGQQGVSFPKAGTSVVDKIAYVAPQAHEPGRVVINSTQYFAGVEPQTWEARIGGYQPLDKWLKDRKGRKLDSNDVLHYMRMVIALRETQRIMGEIDALIPAWPLE